VGHPFEFIVSIFNLDKGHEIMNDSGFSLVDAWKFCATAACKKLGSVCSSIPKKISRDWKRNAFLFTTCACAAASVLGVGSAWGDYKVIDLDLPSPPLAINNHKQIVGTLTDQGKGYIYNAETGTYTWITGTGLSIKDINDNGEVVGAYSKEYYYQKRVEDKHTGAHILRMHGCPLLRFLCGITALSGTCLL
jgi:hypothetical protein